MEPPALTRRDANAGSLFDMVDLVGEPGVPHAPHLPAPADPTLKDACLVDGAGTIPPSSAVTHA